MDKTSYALVSVSVTAAVLAIALAAVTLLSGSATQILTTSDDNLGSSTLSVTGTAQTTIVPDTLAITFVVQEKASTPSEALAKLSEKANRVVSAVLGLGISSEDVKTTSVDISPEYIYPDKEPPRIIGYVATYSIEVRTKRVADAGSLIETAVNSGADQVSGLYFTVSPEQYSTVYRQLLSAAIGDAEAKADSVLRPLNLRKTGVKSVSIIDVQPAYPVRAATEASTGPPILTGTTTLTVSVNVVYLIG